MSNAAVGLTILALASIMNASFTLPMKYTSRWAWENTWLAWTIWALLILPPAITIATVPHLGEIYSSGAPGVLPVVVLFGAGWGVAQVFFGLAVDAIGIALTFSLVLGTSAAVGTLIPLIHLHPERLQTSAGRGVLVGVAMVIAGVLVCAIAGRMRENALNQHFQAHKSSALGIALAILCGFGASFINLGLAFGGRAYRSGETLRGDRAKCRERRLDAAYAGGIDSKSHVLSMALTKKSHQPQICAWRHGPLGASTRDGRALVGQYAFVWCFCREIGRVGTSTGMAALHVAHRDHRKPAGHGNRGMEEQRPFADRDPVERSCFAGNCCFHSCRYEPTLFLMWIDQIGHF